MSGEIERKKFATDFERTGQQIVRLETGTQEQAGEQAILAAEFRKAASQLGELRRRDAHLLRRVALLELERRHEQTSFEAQSAESARLNAELADARHHLEAALEARSAEVAGLNAELADARHRLEAALESRSAEVAGLNAELADARHRLEAALEARSAEVAGLNAELADARHRLEAALEARSAEVAGLNAGLADARHRLEAALEARSAEVAGLNAELADARHRLEAALEARSAEVAGLNAELADARHRLEAALEARSAEVAGLNAELADARHRLTELNRALKAQVRQLELKRRQADERRKRTDDLESTLKARSIEVAGLNAELADARHRLESALESRSTEVAGLNAQLADARHHLTELRNALSSGEAQLIARGRDYLEAQQSLTELHASTSWRITAPLRSARRLQIRLRQTNVGHFLAQIWLAVRSRSRAPLRDWRDVRIVAGSHHFDSTWYLVNNPDVAAAGFDPAIHYASHGWREGRNPGPAFDTQDYLAHNRDVERAGVNPLAHFVRHGAAEARIGGVVRPAARSLQPEMTAAADRLPSDPQPDSDTRIVAGSRYFDSTWYLVNYPDVAAAGFDPAVHYASHGWREGRNPGPAFDTRDYLTHNRDVELAGMNPLVHFVRHGAAEARIGGVVRPGAMGPPPEMAATAERLACDPRPVILMLLHESGGGTEIHVRKLAAMLGTQAIFLMLKVGVRRSFALSVLNLEDGPEVEFQSDHWDHVCAVLHSCNVRRVHVHHTFGFLNNVRSMLYEVGAPYDLTIHDFMLICPRIFLYRDGVGYCGEPDVAGCQQCLREEPSALSEDILWWRWVGRELIEGAERVICPSQDAAARMRRYTSRANLVVVPHEDRTLFQDRRVRIARLSSRDRMRVAVLGVMTGHKGVHFLMDCVAAWKAADLNIDVTLIGESLLAGVEDVLRVTGRYEEAQLPYLIADLDPHLFFFPQQCPETYSYTLSEGLHASVPILAPDLGAFRERTEGMEWCWLYNPTDRPDSLTELLRRIRVEHIEKNAPPLPIRGSLDIAARESTTEFYRSDYLRPTQVPISRP